MALFVTGLVISSRLGSQVFRPILISCSYLVTHDNSRRFNIHYQPYTVLIMSTCSSSPLRDHPLTAQILT